MSDLDYLFKKPITVEKNTSLSHVIAELLKNNISRLVVIDEKSPVGIITEKDIGLFLLTEETEKNLDEIQVSKIMNTLTSVKDSENVENCVEIMLEKRIGSLGILKESELIGIVTKTDIAQHYSKNYSENHRVGDVMTISYISMNSNSTLREVVSKMISEKISRIFLKNDDDEIEGILTFRDLFHVALEQGNLDSVLDNTDQSISVVFTRNGFLSDSGFGNTIQAKDVMTSNFASIDFDQDLAGACDVMIKNKINGIGVKINGKLGGVVSKTDVLKAIHIEKSSK
jgi:CBS domain-containing protein